MLKFLEPPVPSQSIEYFRPMQVRWAHTRSRALRLILIAKQSNMKTPRSCGFLIVKGSPVRSFLLMKHARRWDIPKGHVDPGETDEQCAFRELIEETGIAETDLKIFEDFRYEASYKVPGKRYGLKDEEVDKTLLVYLAELTNDVEIEVTEHEGYQWFEWTPPHSIQQRSIDPLLKYVEDYFESK